jgi:tripartite-type tricarboxylate transporter receptor subunit TctC
MKRPIAVIAMAAAVAVAAGGAQAQRYPTKPVRLIVPFSPGGGTDIVGRQIAQQLTDALGESVVVDNRAGAGGTIGADLVAKAASDGYTLLMGTPGPLTINPNLLLGIPYDTKKDFAPVSLTTISPFILVVHPGVPVSSVKDLIALAKAKPGTLNFGSAGPGSVAHLASEQFRMLAKIDIVHVPYKGASQALIDLLGGRLQMQIENFPTVLPHIRTKKLKALAVGTQQRSTLLPEYPTMEEAGVPGYETSTATGVLAPANTPQSTIAKLNGELVKLLQKPDVKEQLAGQGVEAVGSTPERYAAQIRDELAKYERIVKAANIKL